MFRIFAVSPLFARVEPSISEAERSKKSPIYKDIKYRYILVSTSDYVDYLATKKFGKQKYILTPSCKDAKK